MPTALRRLLDQRAKPIPPGLRVWLLGGTAVVVGVGRLTDEVKFTAFEFFFTDKNLRGSMYGSSNVRTFMPKLLRLWRQGKLDLESMITRRIQLDDVNDAFRAMEAGEVIRSVIDYK